MAQRSHSSRVYGYGRQRRYGEGPTPEREQKTLLSSPYSTETVDTVIANPRLNQLSSNPPRNPGASQSTDPNIPIEQSSRRSLGNFEPIIRPASSSPPQEDSEEPVTERCDENQRLVNQSEPKQIQRRSKQRPPNTAKTTVYINDPYEQGTCCHCLANAPCVALFLWIMLVLFIIGWALSTWKSIDNVEQLAIINLRSHYGFEGLAYSDAAVIIFSLSTFLFSVILVIVSSYTNQKLSPHHFYTSKLNKCGYCLSNTMTLLSSVAVITWTLIIAFTMIPTAALSLLHVLVQTDTLDCVHLPSYGFGLNADRVKRSSFSLPGVVFNLPNVTETLTNVTFLPSTTKETAITSATTTISSGLNTNLNNDATTTTQSTYPRMHCGAELSDWLSASWNLMIPLLISLGFAMLIEMTVMGFLILSSSNSRHLKERMNYLSTGPPLDTRDDKQNPPFI